MGVRVAGAGAAHQIAGVAVGDVRFAGLHFLAGQLAGQFLGRYLAVAMHQHHQRQAVLVFKQQGLDDGVFVHIQFARRGGGAAVFFVAVGVAAEIYLVIQQKA
jgi:hypothetical protein